MKTFGLRLRTLRQEHNLSQEGLARRCAISLMTVNRLERDGGQPSLRVARRLARILGVSLETLLGPEEEES